MAYSYELNFVNSVEKMFMEEKFYSIINVLESFPEEHNNKVLYRFLAYSYIYTGQGDRFIATLKKLEELVDCLGDYFFLFNVGKAFYMHDYQKRIWAKMKKLYPTNRYILFYSIIWNDKLKENYCVHEQSVLPFLVEDKRAPQIQREVYKYLIRKFRFWNNNSKVDFYKDEQMSYYNRHSNECRNGEDYFSMFEFFIHSSQEEAHEYLIKSIEHGSLKGLVTFYSYPKMTIGQN
jgi:hypothetical protein